MTTVGIRARARIAGRGTQIYCLGFQLKTLNNRKGPCLGWGGGQLRSIPYVQAEHTGDQSEETLMLWTSGRSRSGLGTEGLWEMVLGVRSLFRGDS